LGEPYKSPQRKLLRFFDTSRARWKAKCRAAKATLKVLKNRRGFWEESRERWKRRAQALAQEVARVAAAGRVAARERQALKKNGSLSQ
jgi:transposase-like protein